MIKKNFLYIGSTIALCAILAAAVFFIRWMYSKKKRLRLAIPHSSETPSKQDPIDDRKSLVLYQQAYEDYNKTAQTISVLNPIDALNKLAKSDTVDNKLLHETTKELGIELTNIPEEDEERANPPLDPNSPHVLEATSQDDLSLVPVQVLPPVTTVDTPLAWLKPEEVIPGYGTQERLQTIVKYILARTAQSYYSGPEIVQSADFLTAFLTFYPPVLLTTTFETRALREVSNLGLSDIYHRGPLYEKELLELMQDGGEGIIFDGAISKEYQTIIDTGLLYPDDFTPNEFKFLQMVKTNNNIHEQQKRDNLKGSSESDANRQKLFFFFDTSLRGSPERKLMTKLLAVAAKHAGDPRNKLAQNFVILTELEGSNSITFWDKRRNKRLRLFELSDGTLEFEYHTFKNPQQYSKRFLEETQAIRQQEKIREPKWRNNYGVFDQEFRALVDSPEWGATQKYRNTDTGPFDFFTAWSIQGRKCPSNSLLKLMALSNYSCYRYIKENGPGGKSGDLRPELEAGMRNLYAHIVARQEPLSFSGGYQVFLHGNDLTKRAKIEVNPAPNPKEPKIYYGLTGGSFEVAPLNVRELGSGKPSNRVLRELKVLVGGPVKT